METQKDTRSCLCSFKCLPAGNTDISACSAVVLVFGIAFQLSGLHFVKG